MTTPHDKALSAFTEYFVRNYPGPDTLIFDPKWHAPKLFNAAMKAIESAGGVICVREPAAWRWSFDKGASWSYGQNKPGNTRFASPDFTEPLHAPIPEAGNGDGWNDDMSKAPRDGTVIWLGHECGFMEPAYFKPDGAFWVNRYIGLPINWAPRFWQRIPSPPSTRSNDTGREG